MKPRVGPLEMNDDVIYRFEFWKAGEALCYPLIHGVLEVLRCIKIEHATAVLLQSLAYLSHAAQQPLRPYRLLICLGSSDCAVDPALPTDLDLRLINVDTTRAEEIADAVMALFLGLLHHTYVLSRHLSAFGWLCSIQPLCRGAKDSYLASLVDLPPPGRLQLVAWHLRLACFILIFIRGTKSGGGDLQRSKSAVARVVVGLSGYGGERRERWRLGLGWEK
ncbi:hypothetical protein PIB30_083387 [Stylosanthes scabra]|uniref:Uncharacterized protein n=1 Tax=Stylosanthes scabra TaxID=79078 RepID=A0ABU6XS47_9FABA|nr:hypothetical protein [Stylosanthes scabra]